MKKLAHLYEVDLDDLVNDDIPIKYMYSKGVFLVDRKSKENLKTFFNYLPLLGIITSIIVFTYFSLTIGFKSLGFMGILYCSIPFVISVLYYVPLKIIMNRRKKQSNPK